MQNFKKGKYLFDTCSLFKSVLLTFSSLAIMLVLPLVSKAQFDKVQGLIDTLAQC